MGLQGDATTGLHIRQGSATATGSVLVDLVLAAGASSIAFTEPVSGREALTSFGGRDLQCGRAQRQPA